MVWPQNIRGAVSLTYDDGLPVHHQVVAPMLESVGLRGTFYVPVRSDLLEHPDAWRRVADAGHELGNHSIFHPCTRHADRESWVDPWRDLATYTPERFKAELVLANDILNMIDGRGSERTYGNNCCETTLGPDGPSMDEVLRQVVLAARGPLSAQVIDPAHVNRVQLGHFNGDGRTADELRAEITAAVDGGGWIIYMMHGIGPATHKLHIMPEEHRALVAWLGEMKDTIWTAPVAEVVRYLVSESS